MIVSIREAEEKDCEAMFHISSSVHLGTFYKDLIPSSFYPHFEKQFIPSESKLSHYRKRLKHRIGNPDWFIWVAQSPDGEIQGFTQVHRTHEYLKLSGLFVAQSAQGQGIGKQLLEISTGIAQASEYVRLEVIEGNTRAIEMYKRHGFNFTGHIPKPFYGADMIVMQKD